MTIWSCMAAYCWRSCAPKYTYSTSSLTPKSEAATLDRDATVALLEPAHSVVTESAVLAAFVARVVGVEPPRPFWDVMVRPLKSPAQPLHTTCVYAFTVTLNVTLWKDRATRGRALAYDVEKKKGRSDRDREKTKKEESL